MPVYTNHHNILVLNWILYWIIYLFLQNNVTLSVLNTFSSYYYETSCKTKILIKTNIDAKSILN